MTPDATSDPSSLVAVAVANAFALSVAVYISANISGGHVNPAVTFGMAIGGHISIPMSIFYWISQMLGSVMACLVLKCTNQVSFQINSISRNFPACVLFILLPHYKLKCLWSRAILTGNLVFGIKY